MPHKQSSQKLLTYFISLITLFISISTAYAELIRYDFVSIPISSKWIPLDDAHGSGYVIIDDDLITPTTPNLSGDMTGVIDFRWGGLGGGFKLNDLTNFICFCSNSLATSELTFSANSYSDVAQSSSTDGMSVLNLGDYVSAVYKNKVTRIRLANLPIARDDRTATIDNAGSIEIDVLANDSDRDGFLAPDSVFIVTEPVNGTLSIDPTSGIVTYTHNGSKTLRDSFTYTVKDDF